MNNPQHKIFDGKFNLSVKPAALEEFAFEWQDFAELPRAHVVTTFDGKYHLSRPRAGTSIDGSCTRLNLYCSMAYYPVLTPLQPQCEPSKPPCARCLKTIEKYERYVQDNPDARFITKLREYQIENYSLKAVTGDNANWDLSEYARENKWRVAKTSPAIIGKTYKGDKYPLREATAAIFNIPAADVRMEEAAELWREMNFKIINMPLRSKVSRLGKFFNDISDVDKTVNDQCLSAAETVLSLTDATAKKPQLTADASIDNEFLTAEKKRFLELLRWLSTGKIKITEIEKINFNAGNIIQLQHSLSTLTDGEWRLIAELYGEFI